MNLLQYYPGKSFLHRLNPVTKLFAAFLYGIACILCNNVFMVIGLILFMLVISAICGLGKRALGLTKNLLIVGLLMFVIQLLSIRTGEPLFVVKSVVIFTTGGLDAALLLSLRIVGAMLPLMLLFAITQMNDLCSAMVKNLHVPYRYAFIVTTAFRFVPLFVSEYHDIEDAQKARGVELDCKNIFKKLSLVVPLFVPLLISSLKKVDAGAISAEMRGFYLRDSKSGFKEYPFKLKDAITILVCIGIIALAVLV